MPFSNTRREEAAPELDSPRGRARAIERGRGRVHETQVAIYVERATHCLTQWSAVIPGSSGDNMTRSLKP